MSWRLDRLLLRLVHRFRLLSALTGVIIVICLILYFSYVPYCYRDQRPQNRLDTERLPDILQADYKPTPGQSIFFHETSCRPAKAPSLWHSIFGTHNQDTVPVELTARQACAVESAALHNPKLDVFVLFASPRYQTDLQAQPLLKAIQSYPNVKLRNLNIWTYAEDTPINDWFRHGAVFRSRFVAEHFSDLLRYITLYRWGGTYLDLDVILLQSIAHLPPNFVGVETNIGVAAGVINFGATGFGHEVASMCLENFMQNYKGNEWANNGPGVITRILKRICNATEISQLFDAKRCQGFQVMPREAFYEMNWLEWQRIFDEKYAEHTLWRLSNSYLLHLWNKYTKHIRFKTNDNSAYTKIIAKNCPKVYAAADDVH